MNKKITNQINLLKVYKIQRKILEEVLHKIKNKDIQT